MQDLSLGVVEGRFADIVWAKQPISSGELVKICEMELNWKKSTTYTVLKKLCMKGIFVNENGTVKAVITKEEYSGRESERFVMENFSGSLPRFIAAFTQGKPLSKEEAEEIKGLIDRASEV